MRSPALLRWIRALLPACLIVCVLAVTLLLIVLSTAGLPGFALRAIEREAAQRGIYLSVDKIRLDLFDGFGFVVKRLELFESPPAQHSSPFLLISRMRVDVAMDALWSGQLGLDDLKGLELKEVFVSLPLESGRDPSCLEIRHLGGEIISLSPGLAYFSDFFCTFEGMDFHLQGRLRYPLPESTPPVESAPQSHRMLTAPGAGGGQLDVLFQELRRSGGKWKSFLETVRKMKVSQSPRPSLTLQFDVNLDDLSASRGGVTLRFPSLEWNGYLFSQLNAEVDYQSNILTIEQLSFKDKTGGSFSWVGNYSLDTRILLGRLRSSLLLAPVRRAFIYDKPLPFGLKFSYPVGVMADVRLKFSESSFDVEDYQVLGAINSRDMRLAGVEIKRMAADFSLGPDSCFFDNLDIVLNDSRLSGAVLYSKDQLKLKLDSNVPLETYLTLARELGSEIRLPEDFVLTGTPVFFANLGVDFPKQPGDRVKIDGRVSLKCDSLTYKKFTCQELALDVKLGELLWTQGQKGGLSAKDGAFSFQCDHVMVDDVGLGSLSLDSRFDTFSQGGEESSPDVSNGHLVLNARDLDFRDVKFPTVEVEAFYKDGKGFMPKFLVTTADGREARAAAQIVNGLLTLKANSTLLLSDIYKLSRDPIVKMHSDNMIFGKKGKLNVDVNMQIDTNGWHDFWAEGSASGSDALYNKVPVESASASFRYEPGLLTMNNVKLVLLYDGYDLLDKTKYSPRPSKGTFTAKSIINDEKNSTLKIVALEGKAYPEPLMQMFAPEVGQALKAYRFYDPPMIRANGVVDVIDPTLKNTQLNISCSSGRIDYDFLGKTLNLFNPSGNLHIVRDKLYLNNFKGRIWDGSFEGRIGVKIVGKEGYDGSLKFINCNLKEVGATYGGKFDKAWTNANIDFSMDGSRTKDLKGGGKIELTEGDLLTIPFFGPLTTIFNTVFGFIPGFGDLTGSRINQASCDYFFSDGNLVTKNFVAKGGNIRIEGVASVNMDKLWLDMDIRVNLKSLIGLILKPVLIPFGGLFDFHGQGPLEKPEWSMTPFSGAGVHKNQ